MVVFEYKNKQVVKTGDEFSNYRIENSLRHFDNLGKAIIYCIGLADGNCSDNQLMTLTKVFTTMIKK